VDTALYEAVLAMMESLLPEWEIAGYQRERTGSVLPNVAPSNVYPTLDGPVLIAANRDTVFRRLTELMGRPELADDERYATHGSRGANAAELDELIGAWTAGHESSPLLDLLHGNGIPAGLTYRARDMLTDPHFKAREAIVRLAHPEFGELPMQGVFPKLSGTPGEVRTPGPELGQHNADIYSGVLGLTPADLDRLSAAGTI
jgi:formyl-CoA transferase